MPQNLTRRAKWLVLILPVIAVTAVSFFSLFNAVVSAAAVSEPGDWLYNLQQPALRLQSQMSQDRGGSLQLEGLEDTVNPTMSVMLDLPTLTPTPTLEPTSTVTVKPTDVVLTATVEPTVTAVLTTPPTPPPTAVPPPPPPVDPGDADDDNDDDDDYDDDDDDYDDDDDDDDDDD
jgi:hypothetical protein